MPNNLGAERSAVLAGEIAEVGFPRRLLLRADEVIE
jgi:hypothetical protein